VTISIDALARLQTVDEFEQAARAVLPTPSYDYYRSGADEERTLRANRRAFRRYQLWYRVLVDVSRRTLATTVLGTEVAMPILVAPTAYHQLAHPEGEVATARGTAAAGSLMVVSTLATRSLEDVAAVPGPKWFQLYVHRDRGLTRSLVDRAVAAGYRALVVTVDTPVLGRRLAAERSNFVLPPGLHMANLKEAAQAVAPEGGLALASYVASRHDASLTWRDIEWLRSLSSLPVVLKGVVRGDDARLATECGAAGIIVSNHGARQLDGSPATIEALPEVVEAVGAMRNPPEVLMDGGIRWGTDILKALALGARAILLGRPILWGLTVGGAAGVQRMIELMAGELSRSMALAGCASVTAIDRGLVRPALRE
jgi:4-hydroxymandelate oxidase